MVRIAGAARWLAIPALAAALTLGGCSGLGFGSRDDDRPNPNVYPANFKAELLAFMHSYLNDPTGVRDAALSEPVLGSAGAQTRYYVCVRFNARNIDGRYLGRKEGVAIYSAGRFSQFTETLRDQCRDAQFQPFPELEKLTR